MRHLVVLTYDKTLDLDLASADLTATSNEGRFTFGVVDGRGGDDVCRAETERNCA